MSVTEPVATLKKVAAIATVLGLALPSAASAEMIYHRGNGADPNTLDPAKTSINVELNILSDLLEGLVTYDTSGAAYPGVAKSWDISDDDLIYTFHFRNDAKWSNGEPVTAGDFVFSLRRVMTPAIGSTYATLLYPIRNAKAVNIGKLDPSKLGVRAIDDKTLEITLEAPTPYFIDTLDLFPALPVYPPSVKKYGDEFVKPGHMVSNGAYKLESFRLNAQLTVVKNPYFHDAENVAIDKVIYYPTQDEAAAIRRFDAGELDSNYGVPVDQIGWLRDHFGPEFHLTPAPVLEYYAINMTKPPFDDIRVRQALSMAIDRKFLAEKIMEGSAFPAYSFVPPGLPPYGEPVYVDWKDDSILDREDEAVALLKQAGYGPDHPLKLTIHYNTSDTRKKEASAIADMWREIGVEVSLINTDTATHYSLLQRHGDFDIARAGWIPDYPDAQTFLALMKSDNPRFNYAGYDNPDYDALMAKAARTVDPEARKAILHQAQAIIEKDTPNIPLLYDSWRYLVSDKLKGWVDNGPDMHLSRWMRIER
ncbi:MAG: peptide ABC transporter substrate-binding protein [Hyphomicrobiales bacterium]